MGVTTAEEVVVDLLAKTDKLERELNRIGGSVDRRLGGMEDRARAFASKFSGLLATVSAGAILNELSKLADTSKQLDAQLRLATSGFGSFGKAQEDTRKIALATRSSLEATTSLYGNFARASAQTNRSQADAARATETFSKALKIGGADANAAASATLQFGQALASGALRGDEFNSIAEASPRIVRLIADSMGVTQGAVRALAAEGKLTSDVLFRALTDPKFTESIDKDFQQLPATFGEAMQQIENAAVITFGAFDSGGQFSNAIVSLLSDGTNTFTGLEDLARDFGIETRAVFDGLGNLFDPIGANGSAVFDALGIKIFSVKEQIESILGSFDRVGAAGANFANFLNAPGNFARSFTGGPQVTVAPPSLRTNFRVGNARSEEQARARRVEGQLAERFPGVNRDGTLNLTGVREKQAFVKQTPAAGKKKKAKKAPKSPLNEDAFTRQEAQLNDRILRAKGDQADTAEATAQVETDRIEAQRVKNDDLIKGDKRLTEAQKVRLTALTDLAAATEKAAVIKERDVAVERRTSDALQRTYDAQSQASRNEEDEVRSKLDLAESSKDRLALGRRLLELAQKQERADLANLIATQQRVLDDKNATPDDKAIASGRIANAQGRLASLDVIQANERTFLDRREASPGQRFIQTLNPDRIKDNLESIQVDGLDSLNDGLADAITGAKSLGDVFHDVAGSIIKDLLRIAIQQAIIKPIANSLFGAGAGGAPSSGGFGGFLSSLGSLFGGGSSSGSPVFGGGTQGNPAGVLSLFGRASGGFVAAGQRVRTNEGAPPGRVEGFRPVGSGTVIPLGQMANATGRGNTTVVHAPQFNLKGAVVTRDLYRDMQRISQRSAAQAGGAAYKRAIIDTPARLNERQTLGT